MDSDALLEAFRPHEISIGTGAVLALDAEAARALIGQVLGEDHYVTFTDDAWRMEHSLTCRLSGSMATCEWHQVIARQTCTDGAYFGALLGRYRVVSEGVATFRLERADS